jgi:hypothetical protein
MSKTCPDTGLLKDRKQVESLVAKIAEEDEKEAKARAEKQMERLVSPS